MNVAHAERLDGAALDAALNAPEANLAWVAENAARADAPWPRELLALLQRRDWAALAQRLSETALHAYNAGQQELLQRFMECLPDDVLRGQPRVATWLGALRAPADLAGALAAWELAHDAYGRERNWSGRATVVASALQGVLADGRGLERLDPWLERGALVASQRRLVAPATWLRFIAALTYAVSHREPNCARLRDYALALDAALRQSAPEPGQALAAAAVALNVAVWTGDLAHASEVAELAEGWRVQADVDRAAAAAYWVSRLFHDSVTALGAQADAGLAELSALTQDPSTRHMAGAACLNLAHAYATRGEWRRASRLLDDVQRTISTSRSVDWSVQFLFRAWIALGERDARAALDFAQSALHAAEAAGARRSCAHARLAQGAALADAGDAAGACTAVDAALRQLSGFESPLVLFHGACITAYAQLVAGNESAAHESLVCAFGLGRRHRLLNTLLWLPHAMARLCEAAWQHGIEPDYVAELVRVRQLRPPLRRRTLGHGG